MFLQYMKNLLISCSYLVGVCAVRRYLPPTAVSMMCMYVLRQLRVILTHFLHKGTQNCTQGDSSVEYRP